eukprot:4383051-Pyramimonas_sp.AAC.1
MLPRKSSGDRVIGLAPMMCRLWSLIRDPHGRIWTKEVTASWDAALADNSSLREAFLRAVQQEVPQRLGVACGEGLIDIPGFYDAIDWSRLATSALALHFPP